MTAEHYLHIIRRISAKIDIEKYEKLILKKMKIYKIYDVSKTENADSDSNLKDLFCLFYIYQCLEMRKKDELWYHDSIQKLIFTVSSNCEKYISYKYIEKYGRIKKNNNFL